LLRQGRNSKNIDIAGVCALARSLIEAHNVLLYLTEANRSKHERRLRFELMYVNEASDLKRIHDALGLAGDDFGTTVREHALKVSTDTLKENPVFQGLDEKHRNHLLTGRTAYLMGRDKGPRPLPKALESAAYNLFSHNVHAFGLGTTHIGSLTAAGAVNTLFLATEFAIIYLANLMVHYRVIRTRAIGPFSEKEAALLKRAVSGDELSAWIENFRKQRDEW
jgi:hypothetical protein